MVFCRFALNLKSKTCHNLGYSPMFGEYGSKPSASNATTNKYWQQTEHLDGFEFVTNDKATGIWSSLLTILGWLLLLDVDDLPKSNPQIGKKWACPSQSICSIFLAVAAWVMLQISAGSCYSRVILTQSLRILLAGRQDPPWSSFKCC
jgi:hypothetical protein